MEKVSVRELETKLGNIQSLDDAKKYLLTGATEQQTYTVAEGETLWDIMQKLEVSQEALEQANPDMDPEVIKPGEQLVLTKPCPVVNVLTTEVATYSEEIPFEISYEDTATLYKDETEVKLQGTNGQKQVTAEVLRMNGQETARTVVSEETTQEPVNQVVLCGTKEKPTYVGCGNYIYPTRGRLSSGFGYRWGRNHNGIDLATSTGSAIVAADNGKVTFAGRKGSFGNLVIVNHGNGRETYYAHCSKILVSVGDCVVQGQRIANVGSTGNSTGPHCHFEIRVNGTPVNPLNYL